MTVLFVCTGNTCRSPMAAAVLRQRLAACGREDIRVLSAGLAARQGDLAHPFALLALRLAGIRVERHQALRLDTRLAAEADWILTMTAAQADRIRKNWPELRARVAVLGQYAAAGQDIRDPWGGSESDYQKALADITESIIGWLDREQPQLCPPWP